MEIRTQLHLHTTHSKGTRITKESLISPREVVNLAVLHGIKAIAITDHNTTSAIPEVERYAKKRGIILIPGIEIDTFDGHLIGLGVNVGIENSVRREMSALEVADVIKDDGALVYIPHPFDIRKKGIGTKIKEVDGLIEVFNPFNIFGFENFYADYVATKLKRPKVVGGDVHVKSMFNVGITVLDCEPTEESILKALQKGKKRFENCRYMSLREMKEWSLERVVQSYEDIKKSLLNGWEIDTWYMKIANLKPLRKLQNFALTLAEKKKSSRIWDFLTKFSYFLALIYAEKNKREFNEFVLSL